MPGDLSLAGSLECLIREAKQPERPSEEERRRHASSLQTKTTQTIAANRLAKVERLFEYLAASRQFGKRSQGRPQRDGGHRKLFRILGSAGYLQALFCHFPRLVKRSPDIVVRSKPDQNPEQVVRVAAAAA